MEMDRELIDESILLKQLIKVLVKLTTYLDMRSIPERILERQHAQRSEHESAKKRSRQRPVSTWWFSESPAFFK